MIRIRKLPRLISLFSEWIYHTFLVPCVERVQIPTIYEYALPQDEWVRLQSAAAHLRFVRTAVLATLAIATLLIGLYFRALGPWAPFVYALRTIGFCSCIALGAAWAQEKGLRGLSLWDLAYRHLLFLGQLPSQEVRVSVYCASRTRIHPPFYLAILRGAGARTIDAPVDVGMDDRINDARREQAGWASTQFRFRAAFGATFQRAAQQQLPPNLGSQLPGLHAAGASGPTIPL